jgi:serine/threonine-protein kinase
VGVGKLVISPKSKLWPPGLTGCLFILTYLVSTTQGIGSLEYDLFLYILHLLPADRELIALSSIHLAPQWAVLLVYGFLLSIYAVKYLRTGTTAISFVTVSIILFALLMTEVLLAIFNQIYLPVGLPAIAVTLVSSVYRVIDLYHRIRSSVYSARGSGSLGEIRRKIKIGELRSALVMLKQCKYSDELLEVGYELGVLLEAGKNWASAMNLYHWLSQYDPSMGDFVARIEEIRRTQGPGRRKIKEDENLQIVGHYELRKKIAQGSSASVYQAYDMRTHNLVALKVMSSHMDTKIERDRINHWLHEAEIVSQLEHPNIAKIHDAAKYRDTAFIAMDYISGYAMSLRLRKREYITVGECIRICKSVLNALTVAHAHGIIHGDIKPANIMYDEKLDTYIVTDFGAAYTEHKNRQGSNIIVGTPAYMSPEQLEGKKLDGRSDLFSLAVTLYHLLTGHQPFTGSNLYQLKQSIINDQPDLNHFTLPVGIMEVIMKALQKKTYMRFADAQQMLAAVEYCEGQLRERLQSKE